MTEWDVTSARDWIVQQCWTDHKTTPAGVGLQLAPEKLADDDPPWNLILEAAQYLLGKNWVECRFGQSLGQAGPHYIYPIKLLPSAIAAIQDSIERQDQEAIGDSKPVIGFITD